MATTFVKNGSNVLVTSGEDVMSLSGALNIIPDPENPDLIMISAKPDMTNNEDAIRINWTKVTLPAGVVDRNDLITKLSTDFFFRVAGISLAEADARYPQISEGDDTPIYTAAEVDLLLTKNSFDRAQVLIGSTIKALPVGIVASGISTYTLVDNTLYGCIYNFETAMTITGIKYKLQTQGAFTPDQENSIAIFSLSNGTCTKVATTANVGTLWSASANGTQTVALSTPYEASPGLYVVCILYNNSAQTTAPKIYCGQGWGLNIINTFSAMNAHAEKLYFTLAAQNTMPNSFLMSATASADNPAVLILY
jgi:hypothetical protein